MLIGKVKLSEIISGGEASRKLMAMPNIDIKTAFWLAKIAKKCDDFIKPYNETINLKVKEIQNEMILKDEKGELKLSENKQNFIFADGYDYEKYSNKINESAEKLQEEEVDFENIEKIKLSKFENIKIEPMYLGQLLWLIEYDIDSEPAK